jgi:uncharacterized protein
MRSVNKIITALLFAIFSLTVSAQDIFVRPEPARLVNDFAGLLSTEQVSALENALVAFDDSTSTQIAVVTVKDLMGYEANQLAYEIGQKWGVGQKSRNNGVVILVKPKIGNSKGQVSIQAGYGLEAKITDALSKRIIELEMIPQFKQNNVYGGIVAGVNAVALASKGEYKAIPKNKNKQKGNAFVLIFIVIIFIVIISAVSRKKQANQTMSSSGSNIPFWILMGTLLGSSNHSRGSGWSDFSSGSNQFGGFGGGSFGGGGASGSW